MSKLTEAGKYFARAKGPEFVQMGVAKTGTDQIAVEFDILDPSDYATTGVSMQWIGSFANEKSCKITAGALAACGMVDGDFDTFKGISANVVELDVQWDEYQGERRLRVKWVNRPGGGLVFKDKMDAGRRASVAARMKGFLANEASKGPALAATGTDDDPFVFPPKG